MFDFERITAAKLYAAPVSERVVEFSPEDIDFESVARVLSLAVDAKSTSVDVGDGYADVAGRVNFHVIYLNKDGIAKGFDYNADFNARIDGEFNDTDNVSCDVIVSESEVSKKDSLTLTAVLELRACAIKHQEFDALVHADDCYVENRDIYVSSLLGTKTITLPFSAEKNVGVEIQSVLSLCINGIVRHSSTSDGTVAAKASVIARVTYLEENNIRTQDFNIPVEEEIAIDGIDALDSAVVDCTIKNSRIVLQGVTDDNTIVLEGEVQMRAQAFRCEQREIVSDLFMLTNHAQIERGSIDYTCVDKSGYFVERVSGNAMLSDNKPSVIDVSALPYARCYCSRAVADGNNLLVEGVVNTDIVYLDESGYNSVRTEVPFSVNIKSDMPFSKDVCVKCAVRDISAMLKSDREFALDMDLAVQAQGISPLDATYISAVDVGDEREQNTAALSIYVASKDETMLDVCKALSAMPQDILSQNPDLVLPFEDDTRIVYFRKIK